MQTTQSPDIIAFVEGMMERMFINANFHYVDVIPIRNGDCWTLEALVEDILAKLRVSSRCPERILVWFDRENRNETSQEISEYVHSRLEGALGRGTKLHVCIPDRMTENAILADEEVMKSEFGLSTYNYSGDGHHGKGILTSLYKEKNIKYKETSHGIMLLKKIRLSRSAIRSPSIRRLLDNFDLDCWWK